VNTTKLPGSISTVVVLGREVRRNFEKEQNYGLHVRFGSYIASAQRNMLSHLLSLFLLGITQLT
jgi:hypothetical protein